MTLLPIGFVSSAGVALPRIEGKFTAGPSGMSADTIAVHQLDRPRYIVSGPALAIEQPEADLTGELEAADLRPQLAGLIRLGDVWEALDAAGLRPEAVGWAMRTSLCLKGVGSASLTRPSSTMGLHPMTFWRCLRHWAFDLLLAAGTPRQSANVT